MLAKEVDPLGAEVVEHPLPARGADGALDQLLVGRAGLVVATFPKLGGVAEVVPIARAQCGRIVRPHALPVFEVHRPPAVEVAVDRRLRIDGHVLVQRRPALLGRVPRIGDEPLHDRADLSIGQHQMTHEHGTGPHWLKCDPATQSQGRLDRRTVYRDMEVRARERIFVDAPGLVSPFSADRLIDRSPVQVGGPRRARQTESDQQGDRNYKMPHFQAPRE